MKNLYFLFFLPFLFFSCKKDNSTKIKEEALKIHSLGGAIFSYNKKGDPLFITKIQDGSLYSVSGTGAIESIYTRVDTLRSSFEYQSDGKISSFTAKGFYNLYGIYRLSHKYYDYSYPTADQTIIKFSEGFDRLNIETFSSTFKLTSKNGLLTLIEVFFSDTYSNRYDQPTDRIEIDYLGKNPSVIRKYKYRSIAPDYKVRGWILAEKYEDFIYDKFSNPLYVAFNGKPNFYFIDVQSPNYYQFINLYSIGVNNPLAAKVKYYDYDGLFVANGIMAYEPKYDANNNMIYYSCSNQKLTTPYGSSYSLEMAIGY